MPVHILGTTSFEIEASQSLLKASSLSLDVPDTSECVSEVFMLPWRQGAQQL